MATVELYPQQICLLNQYIDISHTHTFMYTKLFEFLYRRAATTFSLSQKRFKLAILQTSIEDLCENIT